MFSRYSNVATSEYCFVASNPTPRESATSTINLNILPSVALVSLRTKNGNVSGESFRSSTKILFPVINWNDDGDKVGG